MTIMRAAPLAAVLALGAFAAHASAEAQNTDFDGSWDFVLTCSVNSVTRQPAFTDRFTAEVNQGAFSRSRSVRGAQGPAQQDRLRGNIQNMRMAVVIESQRGTQRWTTRLDGAAANAIAFDIQGGTFLADGRQVRGCQMSARLARPAPQSIVATALARSAQAAAAMQAQRTLAEAAERDIERLRAEAQQMGDRLQTELDFARFEGDALRAELNRRARQADEAAQRIAALTARASEAETAAAAARAEAASQRQAAQQAAAQLGQANAQASEAGERASRAEAAAAALHTQLEQARRALAEARDQPRQ